MSSRTFTYQRPGEEPEKTAKIPAGCVRCVETGNIVKEDAVPLFELHVAARQARHEAAEKPKGLAPVVTAQEQVIKAQGAALDVAMAKVRELQAELAGAGKAEKPAPTVEKPAPKKDK